MRSREQRVVALGDRCRAGMVGKPGDSRVVLVDRDNSLDNADRDLCLFERATLFDVEFEVAVV